MLQIKTMKENLDHLLKNASCIVPDPKTQKLSEQNLDIGIKNGKITHLAAILNLDSKNVHNLKGLHVLPGVIDSQVHFREPGLTHKEDLESGTKGALLGGVTTVFEMPNTKPSTTTTEAFEQKLLLAKNRCHVNYAAENLNQLRRLESQPHCSGIKVFMGSSTGNLLIEEDDLLEKVLLASQHRVAIHSEDEARLKERKHLAIAGAHAKFHPIWRDEETALNATRRLLKIAERVNKRVHVLHVTTAQEMSLLAKHKNVATVEILPQHLTLSAPECYERLGTFAQMNPPIREKYHQEALWQAVNDYTVQVLASDHAPHTREEKSKTYPETPSGFPGVQTLVPLMLNHVHEKKLSLIRFVEMVSEGPSQVFGLKNKGRIAVGFDADLTIVDLKKNKTIENSWIASRAGWSPYDGMKVTGWPVLTILNGQLAMQDDQIILPNSGQAVYFDR
jgi:dihydroorotase